MRIALDAKYPMIIEDARALLARAFPENPVGLVEAKGGTMFYVSVYSSHLPCLFPQHGPGIKHRRSTCDQVGVFTRTNRNAKGLWSVRINRRDSVERIVAHVGLKS